MHALIRLPHYREDLVQHRSISVDTDKTCVIGESVFLLYSRDQTQFSIDSISSCPDSSSIFSLQRNQSFNSAVDHVLLIMFDSYFHFITLKLNT